VKAPPAREVPEVGVAGHEADSVVDAALRDERIREAGAAPAPEHDCSQPPGPLSEARLCLEKRELPEGRGGWAGELRVAQELRQHHGREAGLVVRERAAPAARLC